MNRDSSNIFAVDLNEQTAKCMVAIAERHGSSCRGCRKPLPAIVDGYCMRCTVDRGLNPLTLNQLVQSAR